MVRRQGIGFGAALAGVAALLTPAAVSATTPPEQDVNAWALAYPGSPGGAAQGDPIRVGYANSEIFAPEATVGVRAAVEYVNAELGGAGGRPIELVECPVNTLEDGASCGAQFANDDSIALVLTGTLVAGNKELYDAINGNKPLIIGNGVTVDDFTTPAGQSYTAGAVGVVAGMAKFALEEFQPQTVAIVANDNAGGQAGANVLVKPILDAAGVQSSVVFVADTATAPDVSSAMQAAGADTADVFLSL